MRSGISYGSSNFTPRSPHGERREGKSEVRTCPPISIHALLTESDVVTCALIWAARSISIHALLTESDYLHPVPNKHVVISIHALLTESDSQPLCPVQLFDHFNPRSPHGERLLAASLSFSGEDISIHALLTESDEHWSKGLLFPRHFNPRSPHGERRRH